MDRKELFELFGSRSRFVRFVRHLWRPRPSNDRDCDENNYGSDVHVRNGQIESVYSYVRVRALFEAGNWKQLSRDSEECARVQNVPLLRQSISCETTTVPTEKVIILSNSLN